MASSAGNGTVEISKDEADVYDRQIRLWGLEAQNKLRKSSVLICGLSGLGAEVAKNLMLCGLKSLTLMDGLNVKEEDRYSNFLLAEDSIGKNRAAASAAKTQALNPMVDFKVIEESIEGKEDSFVESYSVVVLIDASYDVINRWNKVCRQKQVSFTAGSVFGWTGFAFFDFNQKNFLMKAKKECTVVHGVEPEGDGLHHAASVDLDEDLMEKKTLEYASFPDAFNVDWRHKKWLRRAKRLVPPCYLLVKAILRCQEQNMLSGDENKDIVALTNVWREELAMTNLIEEQQTVQPDRFEYLFGAQLGPVCAVVGGLLGQEVIKTLSEGENPNKNIFVYSGFDTAGYMLNFPPPS